MEPELQSSGPHPTTPMLAKSQSRVSSPTSRILSTSVELGPVVSLSTPRTIPDPGGSAADRNPTFSDPTAAPPAPPANGDAAPLPCPESLKNLETTNINLASANGGEAGEEEEFVFRPAYFFFYGSLMDPDILTRVAKLPAAECPPVFKRASLGGYKMKIWAGEYPTLVPRKPSVRNTITASADGEALCQVTSLTNSVSIAAAEPPQGSHGEDSDDGEIEERIQGRIWLATDMEQALRLQQYETAAYIACDCRVRVEDGSGDRVRAVTFCWSGDPNDRDLYDGKFDLAAWQREIKPRLLGINYGLP